MSTQRVFPTYKPGRHLVKGIPFKAHKVTGFSAEALEHHFEVNYGGAVRRLNEIELKAATENCGVTETATQERLGIENSIVLHEIYFDSIGEDSGSDLSNADLHQSLIASLGSFAQWRSEFASMARDPHTV